MYVRLRTDDLETDNKAICVLHKIICIPKKSSGHGYKPSTLIGLYTTYRLTESNPLITR